MASLWRGYTRLVERFPWGSQIGQTGVLCATGDVIAQLVVERKSWSEFKFSRVGRFFIMGTCVVAPCLRSWYMVLERMVVYKGGKAALAKMLLDQSLFAPAFLAVFVSCAGKLQGNSFKEIRCKLDKDYVNIVTTNWKIWPAAQVLNFYLVPFQHRVLFVNVVALFWNTYLASMTNSHEDSS